TLRNSIRMANWLFKWNTLFFPS
ncbi:MAG: hypothetical protein ACKVGY_07120, partial [Candidatus Poseidoniales archaeon]